MCVLKLLQLLISGLIVSKAVCEPCSADSNDPFGFISTEGLHNNNNGLSAYCDWFIYAPYYHVIELQFVYMNIKRNPGCDEDFIAINDGYVEAQLCGSYTPPAFQTKTRYVSVKFQTSSNVSESGFNLTYAHIREPICGSNEIDILGYLAPVDSDGDGFYDNNLDCTWKLVALKRNQLQQLYFMSMDLQSSDSCESDYIEIHNDARSMGVYCGTEQPPLIESRSAVLYINFHSDLSVNSEGFWAIFAIIDDDKQCGGLMTQPTGTIETADRDDDFKYDVFLRCIWAIIAPANTSIELQFLSFDVEYVRDCSFDYVQIYGLELYKGRYCGTIIPATVLSYSNVLFLKFYSDFQTVKEGFRATYRHISGNTATTEFSTTITEAETTLSNNQTTTTENSDGQISTTDLDFEQDYYPVSENHSQVVQNSKYLYTLALAVFANVV